MNYLEKARSVIALEMAEIAALQTELGQAFEAAIEALLGCMQKNRKIVICGVGKSGEIGRKLAATLNSTGAPAVLLDAGNALHGDLGLVSAGDAVIMLSYSGKTDELLCLLPHVKGRKVRLIAITGDSESELARHADITLDVKVQREACPLNLAPTASTTKMLVLCDALAMVLLEARGVSAEDFASLHPSGQLGRTLLTRVRDVMRCGEQVAFVGAQDSVQEVLAAMTRARCGAAIVRHPDGRLQGVFTHGDFVRAFQKDAGIGPSPVAELMTLNPVTIEARQLAVEVAGVLEQHRVDDIVVVNEQGQAVGLVDTQDLTRMRIL